MATEYDAHLARWNAIKTGIPYVPENAIPRYFREHPEAGSPLTKELPLESGGVVQAFSGCVLRWTPEAGVELVTE